MIAMQYGFTLPADYDMSIIDRRVRDEGPLLDGFPRLRFKAYLAARKQDDGFTSAENLYAPFYLWDEPEGIDAFLSSPGFATLTRDFGWPSVRTWQVWHAELGADLRAAKYASREIAPIAPYSNLAEIRDAAIAEARSRPGALATVTGFDPTAWKTVRLSLRPALPAPMPGAQLYTVGHVALP
ncbi:DUF4865 family protein [Pleomorphomonas sp. PLEO]|uniref:DUF4865 family protein n=1 Tax=Pleomorphomonas sp. PLEO TaxID=3239306 RepID=UPI00351F3425